MFPDLAGGRPPHHWIVLPHVPCADAPVHHAASAAVPPPLGPGAAPREVCPGAGDAGEILAIYRTTGETDYILHAVVPNMKAYDALYQRIIAKVELSDVSSSFVMEEIKHTTELPLGYV